jgi:hypothetical protein
MQAGGYKKARGENSPRAPLPFLRHTVVVAVKLSHGNTRMSIPGVPVRLLNIIREYRTTSAYRMGVGLQTRSGLSVGRPQVKH